MRAAETDTSTSEMGECASRCPTPHIGAARSTTTRLDWAVIWPEFKVLVALAAPTIVQGAAQQGMLLTDQIFLGHLGTVSLAAAALGSTYNNIMW